MKRLRNKLILIFLAATLLPTAAIMWMSIALIRHSLSYSGTEDLDALSRSLHGIARDYYRQSCEELKREASSGRLVPKRFAPGEFSKGPVFLQRFRESQESDRYELSGPDGDQLNYLVRRGSEILLYSQNLKGVQMEELSRQYRRARSQVEKM